MATNSMDKGMYAAPQGLGDLLNNDSSGLEIEIGLPEDVDTSVEVDIGGKDDSDFNKNLAEDIDEDELGKISSDIMEMVEADIASRKDWTEMFVKGLEVLGMKYEERTEPWAGACGVFSTVLTEAAVRFQSETILETFPAQGPVKTQIIGNDTPEKEEAAERVREDMNYRLTEEMPEYRPEHERMLFNLGLVGSAFKKVYFDMALGRQTSIYIPAEDVIIPYGASGARTAERVTHIMRKTKNDIKKLQASGFYRDIDLGDPVEVFTDVEKKKADEQGYSITTDDRYQVYEVQIDYVMPGYDEEDGVAFPYIVTIDRGTKEVLSIYRNYEEEDELKLKRQHMVQYDYVPGFGAYGFGYIHLIGGYARAGTALIRQLIDAGTLSNLPGGLKSRGLRVKGDDTPISPGEFRDVDVPSGAIKDNIMALPYKEPSQVLAALLEKITEEGRRLGSVADLQISDMSANTPVGTTLAILERQLKTLSAVQARVHYSMKQEFKLLKNIIRDYAPTDYEYDPEGGDRRAKQKDYDMVEVIPVSDPNSSTMAQRIMQYQAVIQLSSQAPQIYDLPHLHRQMIEVLGVKHADKIVPVEEDESPRDPLSENMAFLKSKPTKAFMYQDHDAHIATHMAMMQDPIVQQMIGQSPMAQQVQGAIMAHLAEHLGFKYRKEVEEMVGVPLPAPDQELPADIEVQLSRLIAQGSQQLLQKNQAAAAQQQQQQQQQQAAQDPLIQLQQQELEIKKMDTQRKVQKDQIDSQLALQRLQLEKSRIDADREKDRNRIQSQELQTKVKIQTDLYKSQAGHAAKANQQPKQNKQNPNQGNQ
jgi:hypothetical protein